MADDLANADTIKRLQTPWQAWGAAAILSLMLVLAPHPGHAATFSAKDSDAIGTWVGDAKDPANHYEVVAGPRPGEFQLISPDMLKVPPITLHRITENAFASASGTTPIAKLTLTAARHARVKVHEDSKKRFTFTYLLLDKQ